MSRKKNHRDSSESKSVSGMVEHGSGRGEDDTNSPKYLKTLDLLTVIFTGILAFFAICSFVELWIQVKDARAAFVKDQRPYVWVEPQVPSVKIGEPLRWDVHYSNNGRTPALDLHSCIQAAYGNAGLKAIHFPSMEDADCSQKAFRSETIVPPGFPAYSTSLGDKPLSERDVSDIENNDGGALIVGVIQYDDSNGNTYETGFCSYRFRTGAVSGCEKYNYIKQIK